MGEELEDAVVVPAIDGPSSVNCLRAFGRRGIRTVVPLAEGNPPAVSSRYCDELVEVPSPSENLFEYNNSLLSLAERPDVRTIFPLREEEAFVLSKYRSEFAESVTPVWPSLDTLRDAHDRVRTVEAARASGVEVPETQLLGDVDDWGRECIVKPRFALLANDYGESMPEGELFAPPSTSYLEPNATPDREAIRAEMRHEPIVQEYVPGTEYSFWALYDHGDPVATCQKRQLRARSYAGGTSISRETVDVPELEAAGRALLDHLDWHGLASVQFVRDADTGTFKLLEINPRGWVSLSCAVQAGVDFPHYYWLLADGASPRADAEYDEGVLTHSLDGELMYLLNVLRLDNPLADRPAFEDAVREVASSFHRDSHTDFFSIDDPGPFYRHFLNVMDTILRD
jgi:predicted ATP-grasp superfamily ATP-dependent carboligase